MVFPLFITILPLSAALGVFAGRARSRTWMVAILYVVIVLLANFVQCLPYFTADPKTWLTTFGSGLIMGCIPLLLVTALPALIACGITRGVSRPKADKPKPKNA